MTDLTEKITACAETYRKDVRRPPTMAILKNREGMPINSPQSPSSDPKNRDEIMTKAEGIPIYNISEIGTQAREEAKELSTRMTRPLILGIKRSSLRNQYIRAYDLAK